MVRAVKISVTATLSTSSQAIFSAILETENWQSFQGFGPLPGIRRAQFIERTEETVGSRIEVVNNDGSSHIETVTRWQPDELIEMQLGEFSPPLSKLATHFTERWHMEDSKVTRTMKLYPRSIFALPILWFISLFLKKALQTHTQAISKGL